MATITQRRLDAVRTESFRLKSKLELMTADRNELKAQRDELLAALKELERTTRLGQTSWTPNQRKALDAAKAAIAKAEQH